jgi:hypothetical protein
MNRADLLHTFGNQTKAQMFANRRHEMPGRRKSLEDYHYQHTLTHVMSVKAVITLFLGLVFQLAQALPGAMAASPCDTQEVSCACCAAGDSCHCAENRESSQKRAPLAPVSESVVKLPAAKAEDPRISIQSLPMIRPSEGVSAPIIAGLPSGYRGLRLSVAFCSFVI